MEQFTSIIYEISNFMWGLPMIIILLGTHLFLTIRLKFPQRYIFKAIKLSFKKDGGKGDISPFGSLVTALASTIGTGNIIGVSTAIALGGPGAVFWCWVTGVLGIATKYAESLLAVEYRTVSKDGQMAGGPMYVLEKGLNMKWLGVLFAIFTAIAAFGIGNTVQSNAISTLILESTGISPYISGFILSALVMLVIIFGVKGISKVCTVIVPFMAIFYVMGCLLIIFLNRDVLGETFNIIMSSAFSAKSIGGGFLSGTMMIAMRYGVARGIFSNESGLGSAPIIAAAARTSNPVKQALISSTGTFWDTVIVCALTGLVIVSSVILYPDINFTDGALMTKQAFSKIPFGNLFLNIGIFFFAFSTILGWSYYGEKAFEYLGTNKAIIYYRILWVIAVFIGAIAPLTLIWNIADIMNGMMLLPNVISLVLLSSVIVRVTQKYINK